MNNDKLEKHEKITKWVFQQIVKKPRVLKIKGLSHGKANKNVGIPSVFQIVPFVK